MGLFLCAAIASASLPAKAFDSCATMVANCPVWGGFNFACYPSIDCDLAAFCFREICAPYAWFGSCGFPGPTYGGAEGNFQGCDY